MTKRQLKSWANLKDCIMWKDKNGNQLWAGNFEDLITLSKEEFHSNYFDNWVQKITNEMVTKAIERNGWEEVVDTMSKNHRLNSWYVIDPTTGIPKGATEFFNIDTDIGFYRQWDDEVEVDLWEKVVDDFANTLK